MLIHTKYLLSHHFIAQFDANSRVICVKMQCMMNGITWQGDKNGDIKAIE